MMAVTASRPPPAAHPWHGSRRERGRNRGKGRCWLAMGLGPQIISWRCLAGCSALCRGRPADDAKLKLPFFSALPDFSFGTWLGERWRRVHGLGHDLLSINITGKAGRMMRVAGDGGFRRDRDVARPPRQPRSGVSRNRQLVSAVGCCAGHHRTQSTGR